MNRPCNRRSGNPCNRRSGNPCKARPIATQACHRRWISGARHLISFSLKGFTRPDRWQLRIAVGAGCKTGAVAAKTDCWTLGDTGPTQDRGGNPVNTSPPPRNDMATLSCPPCPGQGPSIYQGPATTSVLLKCQSTKSHAYGNPQLPSVWPATSLLHT